MYFYQTCLGGPVSSVGGPVPPWPNTGYTPALRLMQVSMPNKYYQHICRT